jgi:hypothetical protein
VTSSSSIQKVTDAYNRMFLLPRCEYLNSIVLAN